MLKNLVSRVNELALIFLFSLSVQTCVHKPHLPQPIPIHYYKPLPPKESSITESFSIDPLVNNLSGAYATLNNPSPSYVKGDIEIKIENYKRAHSAIILKNDGKIIDTLYFSNITKIWGVDLVLPQGGPVTHALGVWYKRKKSDEANKPDFYLWHKSQVQRV